jgi:hypothetical protein
MEGVNWTERSDEATLQQNYAMYYMLIEQKLTQSEQVYNAVTSGKTVSFIVREERFFYSIDGQEQERSLPVKGVPDLKANANRSNTSETINVSLTDESRKNLEDPTRKKHPKEPPNNLQLFQKRNPHPQRPREQTR